MTSPRRAARAGAAARAIGAVAAAALVVALSAVPAAAVTKVVAAAGDISPASGRTQDDDVARMIRRTIRPDAVLPLGDIQYDSATLAEFRNNYALSWGVPSLARITYPVPGNHEYEVGRGESASDPASGYFEYFGRHAAVNPNGVARRAGYYSFRLGDWHLVALNTRMGEDPSREQVRWFRRDLARDRHRCELAYWHHPRWSSASEHGPDTDMQRLWATAVRGGVDVVLNGHEHVYERFSRLRAHGRPVSNRHRGAGAREFVVGTGGKGGHDGFGALMRGSQDVWPARGQESVFGALELRLSRGAYSWTMFDRSGGVVDRGGPVPCRNA
jgi:hypothetical protein